MHLSEFFLPLSKRIRSREAALCRVGLQLVLSCFGKSPKESIPKIGQKYEKKWDFR